ncbi:hypothetical protein INR99_16070 [Chitinilyticum litopenaei]|uniref:Integrase catalytic domain-containing protein n=1 Tax=Chitinilyticum piscinae TaxID=2866724 RepID=A0A8J7K2R6_9NEIS|nr:hypothetical protein [Chitinilyticum piscinae]
MYISIRECQFSSYDKQNFLLDYRLVLSISRRGNYHDNAIAENFFQLLQRERIKRKTYLDWEEVGRDISDYM